MFLVAGSRHFYGLAMLSLLRAMSSHFAPLISLVPLAVLAGVAWRSLGPAADVAQPAPLLTAAASDSAKPDRAADAPSPPDLSFRTGFAALELESVFVKPAGARGFEFTPEAARLQGQKVRIHGWMVKHLHDDPRILLLNTQPLVLNMSEFGLADDLPPWAMHVILADRPGWAPVWTARPLEICGTLELGPRQERDGRISHLRLVAEHVLDRKSGAPADLLKPIGLQPGRLKTQFLSVEASASPPASNLSSSTPSTNPTQ